MRKPVWSFFMVILAVSVVVSSALASEGRDWSPIVQQLRTQPGPELLAELVNQVLARFDESVAAEAVTLLDPQRSVLACLGAGCLDSLLITPPGELTAGQTRNGPSRVYNQGAIVGLLGTFGETLARGLEGFFLLRAHADGSIGLLNTCGEEVMVLPAAHVDQVSVTPIPIPGQGEESVSLPARVLQTRLEIDQPTGSVILASRSPVEILIGESTQDGLFSGVALCGTLPIPNR